MKATSEKTTTPGMPTKAGNPATVEHQEHQQKQTENALLF
jgi:hypothetical protein